MEFLGNTQIIHIEETEISQQAIGLISYLEYQNENVIAKPGLKPETFVSSVQSQIHHTCINKEMCSLSNLLLS